MGRSTRNDRAVLKLLREWQTARAGERQIRGSLHFARNGKTVCRSGRDDVLLAIPNSVKCLQAPAEAAVGAGGRWSAGEQAGAEALVLGAVPDLAEARLGGVTEGKASVALHREGSDAAGQDTAVGGDVHQRPGPAAEGPGVVGALHADGLAGIDCARGGEGDAELFGDCLGLADEGLFAGGGVFEEGGLGTGQR